MYPVAIALTLAAAASPAGASEGAPQAQLQLRPKAAIVTMTPTHNQAPFVLSSVPDPDFVPHADGRLEHSRSSCGSERSLCYDAASGRIVYKPARALMPDIPGLQRENISVKRDKIVLRYSF